MFGVGPGELMVILVIALIVFGPEKLPELMRSAGLAIREFQRYSAQLQETLRETQQEFSSALDVSDVTEAVKDAVRSAGSTEAPDPGSPTAAVDDPSLVSQPADEPVPPAVSPGQATDGWSEYDTAANLIEPPTPFTELRSPPPSGEPAELRSPPRRRNRVRPSE